MMTTMTKKTTMTTIHLQGHGRGTWATAEAKARFSEVIDHALQDGPQTITRKGRKAVVVVSVEEWQRKTKRKGNLAEFFAASPLRGSDLKIKRSKDGPREIEL
jgi:prevent-host-death family protein